MAVSVICFSKDRPLQLEAYLQSLMHYSGIKQEYIYVIQTCEPPISNSQVIQKFPLVNWIAEKNFYDDLFSVVNQSENYILFGCDDVIFKDFFDLNDCVAELQKSPDSLGFSLRLGMNVRFMPFVKSLGDKLSWEWKSAKADYWNYPWDVSASVYRKEFVLSYLRTRQDISNPNRFEAYLAGEAAAGDHALPSNLSSFAQSKCMTITINRVQDEYPNEFDADGGNSAEFLYQQFLNGSRHNWPKLFQLSNHSVHVGSEYFDLTNEHQIHHPKYVLSSRGAATNEVSRRMLNVKIIWWRIMTAVWEIARNILPRQAIVFLKKMLTRHPKI